MVTDPRVLDDEAVLAGVRGASASRWTELWAAVDQLLQEPPWVDWVPATEGADGVITVGYPIYSEPLQVVERSLYEVGAIVPFDWPSWPGQELYPDGVGLERAPAADAVRMLTSVIRAERFGDGTIDACMRNGLLPRALLRLRRWYDEEHRP